MANGVIKLQTFGREVLEGKITWSSKASGTVENSSAVTATLAIRRNDGYTTYGTWSGDFAVGGSSISFNRYMEIGGSWVNIKTIDITFAHKGDGSASCYMSARVNAPSGTSLEGTYLKAGEYVKLDTIPRIAKITSAPNFTDLDNPTIKYTNPAGNTVTTLKVAISTDFTHDIVKREIPKTGSTYTFQLTESERNALRNTCVTSNSRQLKFYIGTIIGGKTYWEYLDKTFTVVNAEPSLNPIVYDISAKGVEVTGNKSTIILNYSQAKYEVRPVVLKGASVKSLSAVNGDNKLATATGVFNKPTSADFSFAVVDSRGNEATKTLAPTAIPYIYPTAKFETKYEFAREDTINLVMKVSGKCFVGNFGAKDNQLIIGYRFKAENEEFGPWVYNKFAINYNKASYNATYAIPDQDYRKGYSIEISVRDLLSETLYGSGTVKALPVFDWSATDFNFNVPVNFSSGATGLGATTLEAEGNSGVWHWRKWSNGFAECWTTQSFTANFSSKPSWGSVYSCGLSGSAIPLPFIFKDMPYFYTSLNTTAGNFWLVSHSEAGQGSVSRTPAYQIVRPSGYTKTAKPILYYYVVGRWK